MLSAAEEKCVMKIGKNVLNGSKLKTIKDKNRERLQTKETLKPLGRLCDS